MDSKSIARKGLRVRVPPAALALPPCGRVRACPIGRVHPGRSGGERGEDAGRPNTRAVLGRPRTTHPRRHPGRIRVCGPYWGRPLALGLRLEAAGLLVDLAAPPFAALVILARDLDLDVPLLRESA